MLTSFVRSSQLPPPRLGPQQGVHRRSQRNHHQLWVRFRAYDAGELTKCANCRQGASPRSREARLRLQDRYRHGGRCRAGQVPLRLAERQADHFHRPHQERYHGARASRVRPLVSITADTALCAQEGAFAFVFKSIHYPDEVVIARRGSPVLIGVKTEKKLKIDFVDVEFGPTDSEVIPEVSSNSLLVPVAGPTGKLQRSQSRAFLSDDGMPQPIEFFIASDASAIVEHTKRVLYLEDDDIAHIAEGGAFEICKRGRELTNCRVPHPPTSAR